MYERTRSLAAQKAALAEDRAVLRPNPGMRGIGWIVSALALVTAGLVPRLAAADSMDPALERLVLDSGCQSKGSNGTVYNPKSGFHACTPDNAAFAKLIAQYGFAVAPTAMHSARTTGYGGFELAIEGDYTTIDSGARYWKLGTQGAEDTTTKRFSVENPTPSSMLQAYSLKIRKGFPFGFEITGDVGYLAQTSLVFGGADVRLSLFEGFRTGIPAYFPELAVGGSVRTVTGTSEFQLTVVGFDAQISKPFAIAGSLVITPYAGYQWLRIFGDSGLIDFTPNTDAVNYCGYTGNNTPATPDPSKGNAQDGQPKCSYGNSADFNNVAVFNPVRLTRHRLLVGAQFRVQMVKIGFHADIDLVDPVDANPDNLLDAKTGRTCTKGAAGCINEFAASNGDKAVAQQFTLAFDIGAVF